MDNRQFIPNVNLPDRPEDMVKEWREHFESSNFRFEEYMTKYSEFERSIKRLGVSTPTTLSVDKFQEFLDKKPKWEIGWDKDEEDTFKISEVNEKKGSIVDLLNQLGHEIQRQFEIPPEHMGEFREDLIDELVADIKAKVNGPKTNVFIDRTDESIEALGTFGEKIPEFPEVPEIAKPFDSGRYGNKGIKDIVQGHLDSVKDSIDFMLDDDNGVPSKEDDE